MKIKPSKLCGTAKNITLNKSYSVVESYGTVFIIKDDLGQFVGVNGFIDESLGFTWSMVK